LWLLASTTLQISCCAEVALGPLSDPEQLPSRVRFEGQLPFQCGLACARTFQACIIP